jgi:RNA polymerase sigma-70 factor (ECF subfamily)
MLDDRELIRRIAQKDLQAFQAFVHRYQGMVLRLCHALLRGRENAEDVAQEVFFQAYRAAQEFRYDCSVANWVRRIAVNRSINFNRDNRKFRFPESLGQDSADETRWRDAFRSREPDSPEHVLLEKERKNLIREAIASLPEKQRTALVLHAMEGLAHQEIAEILNTSVPAVEARLHRAKRRLQKRLAPHLKKI